MNKRWLLSVALCLLGVRCYSSTYYVDAARPDDSGDGLSWATAKRSIQAAADGSSEGDSVVVTNGVYSPFSILETNRASIIQSVNGASVTMIDGGNSNRCVMLGKWVREDSYFTVTNYDGSVSTVTNTSEYFEPQNSVVSGFTLQNGFADEGGGALGGTLNKCILTGNFAEYNGGGSAYSVLEFCTLCDNEAENNGGGAYYSTLSNCEVTGNRVVWEGGGGVCDSIAENCLISGNTSGFGGGANGSALFNCTIADNSAWSYSGGVEGSDLVNCIVWGNHAEDDPSSANYDSEWSSFTYSCSFPLPDGEGNIGNDPEFLSEGDYRLSPLSPCRDLGNNEEAVGSLDLDGNPRIQNAVVDMGAYEGAFMLTLSPPTHVTASDGTLTNVVRVTWDAVAGAAFYRVYRSDLSNGVRTAVSEWQRQQSFDDSGLLLDKEYWYWVVAVDETLLEGSPYGVPDCGYRAFVPSWFVDAARPNDTGDGRSWATAKRTIQAAVDLALEGDAILVADGVYAEGGAVRPDGLLSNRVMIAKAVTLRSVNGAGATVIQGSGSDRYNSEAAVRCVWLEEGVLEGFTLRGGATYATEILMALRIPMGPCLPPVNINTLDSTGGGLRMAGSVDTTEARNCVIEECAANLGGGVYGGTLRNCTVRYNAASAGGGVCESRLNGCTLYANVAYEMGGGADSSALTDCLLVGNSAAYEGGGAIGGTLIRCELYLNSVSDGGHGGGAYVSTLVDCEVNENRACYGGGASMSSLTGCTLSGNEADEEGGGAVGGTLNNCTLVGNTAAWGGGAMNALLTACMLTDNVAIGGGGAADCALNSCVVWNNEAVENGGGVAGGTLNNCTLVGNVAALAGGADSAEIRNCIAWDNMLYDGTLENHVECLVIVSSCTAPLPEGEGNICEDPLFAGVYDGDFRLLAGSPCLDAGSNDCVDMPTDLAGNPRLQDDRVDMGALEGAAVLTLHSPANVQASDGTFGDKVRVTWEAVPGAAYYRVCRSDREAGGMRPAGEWQTALVFDDASAVPERTYVYAVEAAADEDKLDKSFPSLPDTGWKAFVANWYVDAARADDLGDGRSWATAKRTIQAAVDAAAEGDGLLVADGVYAEGGRVASGGSLSNRVMIAKAIMIKSVNGPEFTVIQGAGEGCFGMPSAVRCVFLTEGLLDGFTLRRGATFDYDGMTEADLDASGGGILMPGSKGAEVRNSVIESCRASSGGGASGGTLNACVVRMNSATVGGGGASSCLLTECELLENRADSGGGASGSLLDRCVLSGNQAWIGGGVSWSSLESCTLSFNEALRSGGGADDSTLSGCLLIGNTAVYEGGGYCNTEMLNAWEWGWGILSNCSFVGNCAFDGSGGGASYAHLTDCSFDGNTAGFEGGGVYGSALERCLLRGNVAVGGGGGASGSSLANSLLSGNQADEIGGGAIGCVLSNCTVSANQALYCGGLTACSVQNSIVWGNASQDGVSTNYDNCVFAYSCTAPLLAGDGNIEADPLFVDVSMCDYRLRSGSLCGDAGQNEYAPGATDVKGEPRIQAGTVDMGAHEGAVAGHVVAIRIQGHGSVSSETALVVSEGGAASLSALAGPAAFRYFLTNGVFASSSPDFVWTGVTGDGVLTAVFDSLVMYADLSRPDDSGDGLSWATAKKNLQAALDEARDGDTVLVADGCYGPIETGNRSIAVRSVNGAAVTEINGDGRARCATLGTLFDETPTNTVLTGFTLRNGSSENYGGGALGGTLYNCRLLGNAAYEGGGAYGGSLFNCVLQLNTAEQGGGAGASTLVNCTLTANFAMNGGGASDCIIVNSVMWGNDITCSPGPDYESCILEHSCASPLAEGEGNIEADPLFVDAEAGDFRLRTGSLCVDAGATDSVSGATDFRGQPRVQGLAVDMGACEGAVEGHIIAVRIEGAGCITPNEAQGVADGGQVTFAVVPSEIPFLYYLTNGVMASEAPVFTWNGITEGGMLTAVFDTTYWFVDASRPDDEGDGRSWATAKRTIRAAIDFASEGDTIIVADGVYEPINAWTGVAIQSVNGPARTVIDGGATERCATLGGLASLSGFTLQNGWADYGGGACDGTLDNCVLTRNAAEWAGGGASYCMLFNCVVNDNTAYDAGGGVYGGMLADCVVSNNAAMNGGGVAGAELATRCLIQSNTAQQIGGGAANGVLNDCTLTCNLAESGGGANACQLAGCVLTGNMAAYGGGACYSTLSGCVLEGNEAGEGGGIYECEAEECRLTDNKTYWYNGGCGMSEGGRGGGSYGGMLNGCELMGNSAREGGGAYVGTLNGCELTGNNAQYEGGGAYGGTLNDCSLAGNASENRGGGVAGSTLDNCVLTGNAARGEGGGAANCILNVCTLTDNIAQAGGGAYYSELNNCRLSGNTAGGQGGGAYGGTLYHCTVTGNSAQYGGGVCYESVFNSIVWGNTAVLETTENHTAGNLQYTCTTPLPEGEGNVEGAPLFVDADGGDYRLRDASPCLDAGASFYAVGETDLAGNPRLQGDEVDLGAYEGGVAGHVIAVRIQGRGSVYPPQAQGVANGGTAVFIAEPGLGAFLGFMTNGVSASTSTTFVWKGIRGDGTLTAVFETPVWHVDATRPDDSGSGLSWATAKRTIQAAVDAAWAGETVLVADGVYEPVVSRNKAITVRSVNGAGATAIDGNGAARCASLGFALCRNRTVLSGLTLRNGKASYGGGVWGGTLVDCVLTNNSASERGGGACDSTLSNCGVVGNFAAYEGGGVYGCNVERCSLTDNAAGDEEEGEGRGGGAFGGTLKNCVLTRNRAVFKGGAVYDEDESLVMENCTVFGNSAAKGGGVAGTAYSVINNCIVWGNFAAESANYCETWEDEGGMPAFAYSCAEPLPQGEGNLSADPLFVNPAKGCFQLGLNSPCVNAGANALATREADREGKERVIGGTVDLGAFESLPSELAVNNSNLVWSSGGAAYWYGQVAVTADGAGAVQSSPVDDSQSVWIQASAEGKGTLSFMWRVSSESGRDFLRFYADGMPGGSVSGETAWRTVTLSVTNGGAHTFRWEYVKGKSGAAGLDAGWLDQVVWTPVLATVSATASPSEGGTVTGGGSCGVGSSVTLVAVPNRGWRFDRWENGATDARRSLTVPDAGIACTAFFVQNTIPLAEALDNAALTWSASGDATWNGWVLSSAHDGDDAAQSGMLGDLETSGVRATVSGAGTLSFWWRASCEAGYDYLDFDVDGQTLNWLTGESGWQFVTLHLEAGAHAVEWVYWKDETASEGDDAGWVDQVVWVPDASPLSGFALWAAERGLSGEAAAVFAADRNGDGVANGFEYAYGANLTAGVPLLNIRVVNGRPVVETPKRDPATLDDVDVVVEGTAQLPSGAWTLPVGPAVDPVGKPADRDWFVPLESVPDRAFFRLRASRK